MDASLLIRIVVGLLLAAIVYIVGTAVTSFTEEGLVWGLVAVLIFLVVVFSDRVRGGRL